MQPINPEHRYKVIQRWYRWTLPNGGVWCESRNLREVSGEQVERFSLTLWVMEVRQYETPWERLDGPA